MESENNFALDLSSNDIEGKLDLFAQSVKIGGKIRNSEIIENGPVNSISQYFSDSHNVEFISKIGCGLVVNKKLDTGSGYPEGEIEINFEKIFRIGFMRPSTKAMINEMGIIELTTINPGKGFKNLDEIKYTIVYKSSTGLQFEYSNNDNISQLDIPNELKNTSLLELDISIDINGKVSSYFNDNKSVYNIDKYDKFNLIIGEREGLSNSSIDSINIINKHNLYIKSGTMSLRTKDDLDIYTGSNLSLSNSSKKSGIQIVSENSKSRIMIDSEDVLYINKNPEAHRIDLTDNGIHSDISLQEGQEISVINNHNDFSNSTDLGGIVGKLIHNNYINNENYKRFLFTWSKDIETEENSIFENKYIMGISNYNKQDPCLKRKPI